MLIYSKENIDKHKVSISHNYNISTQLEISLEKHKAFISIAGYMGGMGRHLEKFHSTMVPCQGRATETRD